MAVEHQHSGPEDPLRDLSRLSLFPLTLGAPPHATAAEPETQEPESIQNIFKSMALKRSTKLLEQAQAISKSSSIIQNLYFEAEDKAVIANGKDGKDHPQGRRPALGRKRAQFNLKVMPSDSLANSSIYDIVEPQEYFLALDQMQKADEELKKCRGGAAIDLTQYHQSTTVRNRRLGILGKTASYKHHLSANADTTEAFRLSEAIPERRIPSPAKTSTYMESSNILYPETTEKGILHSTRVNSELSDDTEGEGSIAEKEKSVSGLLEKLFSSFKDLDGGNGAALLLERLQIKSTDVGKMNLTELDSTQRNNLGTLKNTVTKKRLDGSQLLQQRSPTATRSPLAVMATLQRRISLKDPLEDPYTIPPSNDSPFSGDSSLSVGRNRPLPPSADVDHPITSGIIADGVSIPVVVNGKNLSFEGKMHLPVHGAERTIGNKITLEEEVAKHVPCLLENSTGHNSRRFDNYEADASTGRDGCLEKEGNDMQLDASIFAQPDPAVKDLTSGYMNQNDMEGLTSPSSRNMDQNCSSSGIGVGAASFGGDATLQGEVNVMLEGEPVSDSEVSKESLARPSSRNMDQNCTSSGIDADVSSFGHDATLQGEVNVIAQGELVSNAEFYKDNTSSPRAFLPVDGHLENLCIITEENNETQEFQEALLISPDRGRKRKAPPRGQNKQKSTSKRQSISRKSLADAGLIWKSGVRRSTRIKSRPLQYWCGERFLYGRIHDSLATVIGLKYACPVEDGKDPVLKVKSFVPEKYADLVSQAAL